MLSYEQQVQLEAQQAERLQVLLDFAYREWQVADAAITALEEKASRLVYWIGLSGILLALVAPQGGQSVSPFPMLCSGGGTIAFMVAILLALACLWPASRPHIPSPLEIARTLTDWPDRPIRLLLIEKLAASVAELRQIQAQKALRLRRAVVFWLTGLVVLLARIG